MNTDIPNPYASPAIPADLMTHPRETTPASQGKRFLNFIVDTIVVQIVSQGLGFIVGILYAVIKMSGGGSIGQEDIALLQVVGFFVGICSVLGYYVLMESLFQRTVAKFLTGTIVVNNEGLRPTFKQIVGRSLARCIPFEPFSFFSKQPPIGWHDSLSKTLVVNMR